MHLDIHKIQETMNTGRLNSEKLFELPKEKFYAFLSREQVRVLMELLPFGYSCQPKRKKAETVVVQETSVKMVAVPRPTEGKEMNELSQVYQLVRKLRKEETSQPFRSPVNPKQLDIPLYFNVVAEPMDLRTIQSNIRKGLYNHPAEVHRDIYNMLMNSYKFNQKHTPVYRATIAFENAYLALKRARPPLQLDKSISFDKPPDPTFQNPNDKPLFQPLLQMQSQPLFKRLDVLDKKQSDLDIKSTQITYKKKHLRIKKQEQCANKPLKKMKWTSNKQFEEQQQPQPQKQKTNKQKDFQNKLAQMLRRLGECSALKQKNKGLFKQIFFEQQTIKTDPKVMSHIERKQLAEKIHNLPPNDFRHVHEILFRKKRTRDFEINNNYVVDIQLVDARVLKQISNFIKLRKQPNLNLQVQDFNPLPDENNEERSAYFMDIQQSNLLQNQASSQNYPFFDQRSNPYNEINYHSNNSLLQ